MLSKSVALAVLGIHSAAAFAPSFAVQFAGVRPTAFCQHALATAAPGRCNTLALRMADEATMNIDQIVIGKTYPGSVTSTTQYGAFVNIGCGQDGLVHVSELSDGYVANVNSVVNVGDSVQVRVVKIEDAPGKAGRKKIGLSMRSPDSPRGRKQTEERPKRVRNEVPQHMRNANPEVFIDGTVASVTDFGAFVTVAEGVDGLCHVSQLAEYRVEMVRDVVNIGDKVKVRIIDYDEERGRLALSMRKP